MTKTRPGLILSPKSYNQRTRLALLCPVTSKIKGYPFEVLLPEQMKTRGVVLADQLKSLDWQARSARKIEAVSRPTLDAVLEKVMLLLEG